MIFPVHETLDPEPLLHLGLIGCAFNEIDFALKTAAFLLDEKLLLRTPTGESGEF